MCPPDCQESASIVPQEGLKSASRVKTRARGAAQRGSEGPCERPRGIPRLDSIWGLPPAQKRPLFQPGLLLFLIPYNVFRELWDSEGRKRGWNLARVSERKRSIKRRECRVSNLARIYGALCKTAFLNSAIYLKSSSFSDSASISFLRTLLLYLALCGDLPFFISVGESAGSANIHLCIEAALTFINLTKICGKEELLFKNWGKKFYWNKMWG